MTTTSPNISEALAQVKISFVYLDALRGMRNSWIRSLEDPTQSSAAQQRRTRTAHELESELAAMESVVVASVTNLVRILVDGLPEGMNRIIRALQIAGEAGS